MSGVHDDVFHHRAEALGSGVDFRLGLGRQADHLGVAAALEVEDRGVGPAVLVVADQRAAGVGRQRRLAGARQAEEHRRVAFRPDVGGAMHGHDAGRRQQIIEQAEDGLLHLAAVARAADEDELVGEGHRDHRLAAAAVARGIGAEAGQIDDRVVGGEAGELALVGADQHRADEEVVPGEFVDDAHVDAMRRLRTAEQILDEQVVLGAEVREKVGLECGEMFRAHVLVGLAPPDGLLGLRVADDVAVLDRAAGVRAGFHHQRTVGRELALAPRNRGLDQHGRGQVPVDARRFPDDLRAEMFVEAQIGDALTH